MSYTTQCPSCQTRFKVNDKQLSAANGLVRCGRCSHVFNATEHFVSTDTPPPVLTPPPLAPQPAPAPPPAAARTPQPPADPMDDFELELPDFDPQTAAGPAPAADFELEAAPALAPATELQQPDSASSREAEEFQRALAEALQTRKNSPPPSQNYVAELDEPEQSAPLPDVFGNKRRRGEQADDVPPPAAAASSEQADIPAPPPRPPHPYGDLGETDEDSSKDEQRRNPLLTVAMVLLAIIGSVLLAGQLVYFNRTRIAAEVPEARPALEAFCHIAGCSVPWPTDIAQIRTEWSELAFVPEHANLIQLSATLKNHAAFAQNYPMLEVSLKDADDQVLIRKVFSPKEYLKADDFKLQRFNANSEVKVTMRLDAGKVRAMGYSLYWFYP